MKTVQEIIEYLEDEIESEKDNARESSGHLWSQAVAAHDALQQVLDFINEGEPTK